MIISKIIKIFYGADMIDVKVKTLLAVAEYESFTRAAEAINLTQPAVSHHISQLEKDLGAQLFIRRKGKLLLTKEGEIAVSYAKRLKAMDDKMRAEIADVKHSLSNLRIGVTHTSESNLTIEVLAKCSNDNPNISITIITDTIKNLYSMLEKFEIDIAIVEEKHSSPELNSLMLDTDYLVCVMSTNNPLSRRPMVTLADLKRERLILRLPTSATRKLFEASLESINESIEAFNVDVEVDNIATIKDLIRKDFGVSILAKSACMDELSKGKIAALPIENLSMIRETNIIYHKTFSHPEVLRNIVKSYREMAKKLNY